MKTLTLLKKNVYLPHNTQEVCIEILVHALPTEKETAANPVLEKTVRFTHNLWRLYWALWARPTVKIQIAPGEYTTYQEQYHKLHSEVAAQNYLRPY